MNGNKDEKEFFKEKVKQGEIHKHWETSQKDIRDQKKVKFLKSWIENIEKLDENISDLEKELEVMKAKMDSVSQLPGALYSKAHTYFEQKQYNKCMTMLILISEKYPDWDRSKVEKKYELAYKEQKEYEKEQARIAKKEERKKKREAQMVDSIEKNVESIFDNKLNAMKHDAVKAETI